MKKPHTKFCVFAYGMLILLLSSCGGGANQLNWHHIPADDYDLIASDSLTSSLWAAQFGKKMKILKNYTIDHQKNSVNTLNIDFPIKYDSLDLCASKDIWITTGLGLLKYNIQDDKWESYTLPSEGTIVKCSVFLNGNVVAFDETKLFVFDGVKWETINPNLGTIYDALQDDSGSLWLLMSDGNIYKQYSANEWRFKASQRGFKLYFSAPDTLFVFDSTKIYRLNIVSEDTKPELFMQTTENDWYQTIAQDADKATWIISTHKILRIRNGASEEITLPSSFFTRSPSIRDATIDTKNNIIYMMTNQGIFYAKIDDLD